MPSKSKKQHNLMEAVAHSPAFAKKVGIKQAVGEEFAAADKGKRFGTGGSTGITIGGQGQINKQRTRFGSVYGNEKNVPNVNLNKYIGKKEGGIMKDADLAQDKALIKRAIKQHDAQEHKGGKGTTLKLAKGGVTRADGCIMKGHTKGKTVKMCMGGKA